MKIPPEILEFLRAEKRAFIATSDREAIPHLSTVGSFTVGEMKVTLTSFFCARTVENLSVNPRLALLFWSEREGKGFQIIGKAMNIKSCALLDGYIPDEREEYVPQEEWSVEIEVERIFVARGRGTAEEVC